MATFYVIAGAIALLAATLLVWPFIRQKHTAALNDDREQLNIDIARQKHAELKTALDRGEISQTGYQTALSEIEQSLAVDLRAQASHKAGATKGRWAGLLIVLILPLSAGALYFSLGSPGAIQLQSTQAALQNNEQPTIDELIAQIKSRLAEDPEDATGWFVLARTYMVSGQYQKSVDALRKLHELVGDEPTVLVRMADAIVMSQGGQFSEEPVNLLKKALAIAPEQPQALWLMGVAEERTGNLKSAVGYWQKAKVHLAEDPRAVSELSQMIASANNRLGETTSANTTPATENTSITVRISLAENLSGAVNPSDTVFVFATAQNGPKMPLAAVKKTVEELPLTLVLDDSKAMSPALKLSSVDAFNITARISTTGTPTATSGDLFGEATDLQLGLEGIVSVNISQRVP